MTLYNKSGTVYKLSGPNPVMKDQKMWGDFITHNMTWKPEFSEADAVVQPINSNFYVKESFLDELEAAKEEIKVVETRQPETQMEFHKSVIIADTENNPIPASKEEIEKTFIYCLPAQIRERQDVLYGDSYQTIKYGEPTSFEAVVIAQNDFSFEIWTDFNKIEKGSILYPKTGFKRWWRVQKKSQKAEGWLLKSIPSDYQPSFDLS